jgi:hypothetical protein
LPETVFWKRLLVASVSKYPSSSPAPSTQKPGLVIPRSPNAASPTQFGATNMPIGRALKAALM